jgi:hypothetical protein
VRGGNNLARQWRFRDVWAGATVPVSTNNIVTTCYVGMAKHYCKPTVATAGETIRWGQNKASYAMKHDSTQDDA